MTVKEAPVPGYKKAVSAESFVFLAVAGTLVWLVGRRMGVVNMVNTMMNTAFDLLIHTCFYIMAIAVLAGAVASLLTEFGVVSLINKLLSPLMKPMYDLPGASVVGILATYMSDNPAILTLADDSGFRCYFRKYQLPALTNLGTSFGMGLIISTFMIGLQTMDGSNFIPAVLIGNLGAVLGSIVSVRLMILFSKKEFGVTDFCETEDGGEHRDFRLWRRVRPGGVGGRFLEAMLAGGKSGVTMGMAIIPGVLTICTLVMLLTKGPSADGAIPARPTRASRCCRGWPRRRTSCSAPSSALPARRRWPCRSRRWEPPEPPSGLCPPWSPPGRPGATTSRFSPPCACAGAAI